MIEKNARYEGNWYFAWLIERREQGKPPEWLTAHGQWTTDANRAAWFARKEDADMRAIFVQNKPYSLPMARAEVIACEHGFDQGESSDPTCEWVEIEEGTEVYNTCKEGEEFHLTEGMELWPHCHWCGRKIVAIPCASADVA